MDTRNYLRNVTLTRLLAKQKAIDALMRIEGFRSHNSDIESILKYFA